MKEQEGKDKYRYLVAVLLGLIILLAAYLRFVTILETQVDTPIRADAAQYFAYGYNLRHHHTYSFDMAGINNPGAQLQPDAMRPPGYSLFLSLFFDEKPTVANYDTVLLIQALLSTITVLVSFFLLRHFLNPWWALGGTLLITLSPHLVVANIYLLTETLFNFCLVLAVYLFIRSKNQHIAWLAMSGGLLGYTALVRPTAQYLVLPFALLLFDPKLKKLKWQPIAAFILGVILIFSPWTARNLLQFGKTSDNNLLVATLHHGMYPDMMYNNIPASYGYPYRFDPRGPEIGKNLNSVLHEIARRFKEEPGQHLKWYLFGKPVMYWQWETVEGVGDVFLYPVKSSPYLEGKRLFVMTHDAMKLLYNFLAIFGFVGSISVWLPQNVISKHQPSTIFAMRVVSVTILFFTAMHMVAAPFARYSIPLQPLLFGSSLFGLSTLITATRKQFRDKSSE